MYDHWWSLTVVSSKFSQLDHQEKGANLMTCFPPEGSKYKVVRVCHHATRKNIETNYKVPSGLRLIVTSARFLGEVSITGTEGTATITNVGLTVGQLEFLATMADGGFKGMNETLVGAGGAGIGVEAGEGLAVSVVSRSDSNSVLVEYAGWLVPVVPAVPYEKYEADHRAMALSVRELSRSALRDASLEVLATEITKRVLAQLGDHAKEAVRAELSRVSTELVANAIEDALAQRLGDLVNVASPNTTPAVG